MLFVSLVTTIFDIVAYSGKLGTYSGDGCDVGCDDGSIVGDDVGCDDGSAVGDTVGSDDGLGVGSNVGWFVAV